MSIRISPNKKVWDIKLRKNGKINTVLDGYVVKNGVSNRFYSVDDCVYLTYDPNEADIDRLYFTSRLNAATIKLDCQDYQMLSSEDGYEWGEYQSGTKYTFSDDSRFYIRKSDTEEKPDFRGRFSMTGREIIAHGNIQWLIDSTGRSIQCYDYCFANLFYGCSSLVEPPNLPAIYLAPGCYMGMFGGSGIYNIPHLPAQQLYPNCYNGMFYHCNRISEISAMVDCTYAKTAYENMFQGCNNLSNIVGVIPYGDDGMFMDCSKLSVEEEGYGRLFYLAENSQNINMFVGTAGPYTRTPKIGYTYHIYKGNRNRDYLYFENMLTSASQIEVMFDPLKYEYEYSTLGDREHGGISWYNIENESTIKFTDKLWIRNKNKNSRAPSHIYVTGKVDVRGDISFLKDKFGDRRICTGYDYDSLFSDSDGLYSVIDLNLDDLQLSDYCYKNMFRGCTNLIDTPHMNKQNLSYGCYSGMFKDCNSLEFAYITEQGLNIKPYCFEDMFNGCKSLQYVDTTELFINDQKAEDGCFKGMFSGCTNMSAPLDTNITSYNSYKCCFEMYKDCKNLYTVPRLNILSIGMYSMESMFYGCTRILNTGDIYCRFLGVGCYRNMFNGCSSLTSACKLDSINVVDSCYDSMFENCIKLSVGQDIGEGEKIIDTNTNISTDQWCKYMFNGTSGSFSGTPLSGHTYYQEI